MSDIFDGLVERTVYDLLRRHDGEHYGGLRSAHLLFSGRRRSRGLNDRPRRSGQRQR